VQCVTRFVINDTFRSDLCLLYPPYLIAIAAIYLTLALHAPTSQNQTDSKPPEEQQTTPRPRRSSRQAAATTQEEEDQKKPGASHDPITFLAELNVSVPLIATIVQEIISMYALWERYKEDPAPDSAAKPVVASASPLFTGTSGAQSVGSSKSLPGSRPDSTKSQSDGGSPTTEVVVVGTGTEDGDGWGDPVGSGGGDGGGDGVEGEDCGAEEVMVTPFVLTKVLMRMREVRMAEQATSVGRSVAVNKMLERTQAAG
jgi:cyclin-C